MSQRIILRSRTQGDLTTKRNSNDVDNNNIHNNNFKVIYGDNSIIDDKYVVVMKGKINSKIDPSSKLDELWRNHVYTSSQSNHNTNTTTLQTIDKFTGYRRKHYPHNDDCYEGYYNKGRRHGIGVYLWFNGDKYNGQWDMDLMHGQGTMLWPKRREQYKGLWSKGEMHGKGVLYRGDGVKLSGTFQHGLLCGYGNMKCYSHGTGGSGGTSGVGDNYEGFFVKGKRNGYGEYEWANGSSYKGQWLDDQMNGIGQLSTVTGRRDCDYNSIRDNDLPTMALDLLKRLEAVVCYDGDFVQDTLHGDGIAEMVDGSIYQGQWKHDKFDGWGCLKYLNGSSYEGGFKDGLRSGMGTMYFVVPQHHHYDHHHTDQDDDDHEPELDIIFTAADEEELGNKTRIEEMLAHHGGTYIGGWIKDVIRGEGVVRLPNGLEYRGFFDQRIHR